MLWTSRLRLRVRALLHRDTLDGELAREMEYHLAEQKAEYIAQGMSEREADAAARRMFGTVASVEEQCRDERRTRWVEDAVQDTRFALRSFAISPGFAVVAVLTLALGIGANTAFFSAAYGILFRPLPYPQAERLIDVEYGVSGIGPVTALRDISRAVEYAGYFPNDVNVQLGGEAARLRAAAVTWNLLRVLGVNAARGRWFRADEERSGQHRVAVLSDRAWRERFGADPGVIGTRLLVNDEPFEIAGVMPRGFAFPTGETELWIPIRMDSRDVGYMWGAGNLLPIGRLREGMTLAAAQAELRPVIDRVRKMFPWRMPDEYGASAHAIRYDEALSEGVRAKLFALSAAAMLLLLIACGNVANLLLARAVHREREFAMREALGARQGRLIRQALTENFVLMGAGGILGAIAAAIIVKLLPVLLPKETPRLAEVVPDASLLFVTAASMILTVIAFGAAPLLRTLRANRETLVGRATTPSRRSSRLSFAVVACELALATVLLIGAGLMARTLWQLGAVDSGLHTTGAVTARISAGPKRCGTVERCWALLEQVNAAVANVQGVRGVNWANAAPLEKAMSAVASDVEGYPRPPGAPAYVIWQAAVTPGYFRTLGIPLLAGRLFTDADRRGGLPVLVISESTAKKFWTVETAIGKRMRPMSDREWRTVVGVVGDVAQYALTGFPSWVDGVEYVPLAQVLHYVRQNMELTMIVESSQPESAGTALPAAVRQQVPDVVVARVASLGEIRSASTADQRSTAWLLALLAAVGLSLGLVGVYGVISNVIAQRTREIGIRIAIGATAANVIAMVVRETLLVAAIGCGVGLAGAYVMSRYLESLLFGVTAHDPPAFAVLPVVLLGTALVAAAIPGWRASRTDPAMTLREE